MGLRNHIAADTDPRGAPGIRASRSSRSRHSRNQSSISSGETSIAGRMRYVLSGVPLPRILPCGPSSSSPTATKVAMQAEIVSYCMPTFSIRRCMWRTLKRDIS